MAVSITFNTAAYTAPGEVEYQEGLKWLEKAERARGSFLITATSEVERERRALGCFQKASQQGLAKASFEVGLCYVLGRGVAKDETKAYEWFHKAEEQADVDELFIMSEKFTRSYARWKNTTYLYDNRAWSGSLSESFNCIKKAAEKGSRKAQFMLGEYYSVGERGIVEKNEPKAATWYQKAADQGDEVARTKLNALLSRGVKPYEDCEKDFNKYLKDAEQGDANAQYEVGCCYDSGRGVEKDYKEAVKWYRKAAEQGHAGAQCNLGYCYAHSQGVEKDYNEAVRWYRKAAEQGDAWGQNNLGWCYNNGTGVAKDEKEAAKWFRRSADQGNKNAKKGLDALLAAGITVEDTEEDVTRYRKLAEQGNTIAKKQSDELNKKGIKASDTEDVVVRYRTLAEQGDADAQNNLAYCYYEGEGVKKDVKEAFKWYSKAAEQGLAKAQNNLGEMYLYGEGTEKDLDQARKWFRKAADQGHAEAKRNLENMKNK